MDLPTCIPIVTVEPDGRIVFHLNNLLPILNRVGDRNFAVIAVAGPKRTGKSYLCKNLLYYLKAKGSFDGLENGEWFERSRGMKDFVWRNGSERCTSGIVIWSEPIIIDHNGENIAVLLMDTEGSFDDQTNTDQSARIFAWSSLLSSNFIYNIKNDIREDTLQFLEVFLEYASLANPQDGSNNSMQKLTFSVRDCEFSDYKSGYYDESTTPPGQNLNFYDRLLPNYNPNMSLESRQIRENLHSRISEIGICLFPHPGQDLSLRDREDNLDVDFASTIIQFTEFTVENLKLKHMFGNTITGLNFIRYVQEWHELFRGNRLPEQLTMARTTARLHNQITIEESLRIYENSMRERFQDFPNGMDDDQLVFEHETFKTVALSFFQSQTTNALAQEDDLSDNIDVKFVNFMEDNAIRRQLDEERRQAEENNALMQDRFNQLEDREEELNQQVENLNLEVNQANRRARVTAIASLGVAAAVAAAPFVAGAAPAAAEAVAAGGATLGRAVGRQVVNSAVNAAPAVAAALLEHFNGNNRRQ